MKPDSSDSVLPDPRLPARDPHGHKGTFGAIAVVGGSVSGGSMMTGAPALAALGALRAGAGLVRLVCPGPVLPGALMIAPSATGLVLPTDSNGAIVAHEAAALLDSVLGACDALAIGPGLGSEPGNRQGIEAVVLRVVQQEERPVVVDADAINALARMPELARDFHARAILTPHPGEFRRLAEPLRVSLDPTDPAQRPAAAEAMAQKLGCIVVLKGAGTVVTDGYRTWVCPRGHPCLGTAGTGDVLTGVLAGLIGQEVGQAAGSSPDLFETARAGVLVHALAGERWAEQHGASAGLLATELADLLPPCVESIREVRS
ncbi:NAD(P)H-hydrate epimerase / ADP-dependent (S)-NAD(P)H-hydrate dehydratase [hydrothermal vent metagenome]|uniref:NAD(P)H-hydrate epimerase / ADP-dependent (S)-NAD(P)H-hydrate dehydratase n=1 Tax=hydrothermal vent metagenome TaxID=652676 RepID=A0A3B1E2L8_9ZZZZ